MTFVHFKKYGFCKTKATSTWSPYYVRISVRLIETFQVFICILKERIQIHIIYISEPVEAFVQNLSKNMWILSNKE